MKGTWSQVLLDCCGAQLLVLVSVEVPPAVHREGSRGYRTSLLAVRRQSFIEN